MWKTTIFWAASFPCHKKLVILFNLRYLVTPMAPDNPTLINCKSDIVNLKWLNLKYKTDCFIWKNLNCASATSHFNAVFSGQLRLSLTLRSFIQRYASGTSKDNEWINLHRFWVHLLLLFAIISGVMRNYLFAFKIFIPTPYCR